VSYRFTGDFPLIYPGYRDLATDRTLTAVPETEYDMEPAGGRDLAVPPGDGRWELVTADPPAPVAPPPPLPAAPAPVTKPSAEDEGN
jgi:hypothetical protein